MLGTETIDGGDEFPHRAVVRRRGAEFQLVCQLGNFLLAAAPFVPPDLIDIEVVEDSPQPCSQPFDFAQLAFLAQRPFDTVLDQIVRQRGIARQRYGVAPEAGELRHKRVGKVGRRRHCSGGRETGRNMKGNQPCLIERIGIIMPEVLGHRPLHFE